MTTAALKTALSRRVVNNLSFRIESKKEVGPKGFNRFDKTSTGDVNLKVYTSKSMKSSTIQIVRNPVYITICTYPTRYLDHL
jgi:hypothetical protein